MADERVFLSEANVYVSNTKVMLHGTTYATANITSVSKRYTQPNRGCAIVLLIFGVVMSLGGMATWASSSSSDGGGPVFVALLMIVASALWFRALKPTYHVVLASSSGERHGLSSKDNDLVDRVISAITNAITYRG